MNCKRCGSTSIREEITPGGPHYGKAVCAQCGIFIKWLPAPIKPVALEKVPDCDIKAPLPNLIGSSPAQISFGESMRADLLSACNGRVAQKVYAAMRQITDASWWIANGKRPNDIHWPATWS